jgi:hypothetical protein
MFYCGDIFRSQLTVSNLLAPFCHSTPMCQVSVKIRILKILLRPLLILYISFPYLTPLTWFKLQISVYKLTTAMPTNCAANMAKFCTAHIVFGGETSEKQTQISADWIKEQGIPITTDRQCTYQCNIEARSWNHCYSVRRIRNITYTKYVFVLSVIHHAECIHRTIFPSVACPALQIFPHYLINVTILGGKSYCTQNVCSSFLYNFPLQCFSF